MSEKVVNDAVAYIESIAAKKGRNVKWAAQAVQGERLHHRDRSAAD